MCMGMACMLSDKVLESENMAEVSREREELLKAREDDAIREILNIVVQKGDRELITAIMETVGTYYEADRCYIFEEDPTRRYIANTYEWCAPGVIPEKDNLQDVPIENLEPWLYEFKKQGTFYLNCDDEYAKKEPLIYQVLEPQNIQCLMAAPMMEYGREIGFLGVDNPRKNTGHKLYLSIAATSAYHELRSIHDREKLEQSMRRNAEIQEAQIAETTRYNNIIDAISSEYHTVWLVTKADMAGHFVRSNGKTTIQKAVDMGKGNVRYDDALTWYIHTYVVEEDRARVAGQVSSATVLEEIRHQAIYTVNYKRRDEAGKVTYHQMAFADADDGFILAFHDIDALMQEELEKQKAMQKALNAAESATQEIEAVHLALGSGDWTMNFDENGAMTECSWSQKFREMLGYESLEDFPDALESWSDLLIPEDKERVLNHYWNVVRDYSGKKTYDVYYRLSTKNCGERWFRAIGRLTRREDGSPIKFYGIFLDVDEEIRTRQNEEAKSANLIDA